ncbi:unnamed protein product [Rotaria sordida]|uniref:Uncharacterized protein n=1 Tax=Rotaria sordida TaxID=392033 RepID=A0A815XRN9_9BILA|nr:unnamed protein product [Rotaria sordida]
MFRFLYAKILCRPCFAIKRRREMKRRIKLEEESGINIHCIDTNGWSIDENDNTLCGNQHVTVSLTITMLIIAAYIWIDSAIFNSIEQ